MQASIEQIGDFVKRLRTSRGVSLRGLAEAAGVAKSTLIRWETGEFRPRLPELDLALSALHASAEERGEALRLLDAPRSVAQLRDVAKWPDGVGDMPAGGDLLRAMRMRRRCNLEQVAASLGVRPSTVCRWEQAKSVPPERLLDRLLEALGAMPEEREALCGGKLLLALPDEGRRDLSLEVLEAYRDAHDDRVMLGDHTLMDLGFLSIAAQLSTRFRNEIHARVLLGRVYAWYALGLMWADRRAEAMRFIEHAQDLLLPDEPAEALQQGVITTYGLLLIERGGERGPRRAFEWLRGWVASAEGEARMHLYRCMAEAASKSGDQEAALEWLAAAFREEGQIPEGGLASEHRRRLLRAHQVEYLLRAGRASSAVSLIPSEDHYQAVGRIIDTMHRARALLDLGERQEAAPWVERANLLIRQHDYPQFLAPAAELAGRLGDGFSPPSRQGRQGEAIQSLSPQRRGGAEDTQR